MAEQRELCSRDGISLVLIGSGYYPKLLSHIHNPPPVLFVRGDKRKLSEDRRFLAVVGSRKADIEGCNIAASISRELSEQDITIVSGLALGVDGAAHQGALKGAGSFPTVAVLGNGLSTIYPRRHRDLADRILDGGGAIVSIFEPQEPPFPQNFLNRNRIISGLSHGALIVQAAKRSGALSTARHALEQGREVLVVPGGIRQPRYEGGLRLIRNGAVLVTCPNDVLEELSWDKAVGSELVPRDRYLGESSRKFLTKTQIAIVDQLDRDGPLSFDSLLTLGNTSDELRTALCALEVDEFVERIPGNNFALISRR
jgi:DNA processing protein